MIDLPSEPKETGHFYDWLRKLWRFGRASQPRAGLNVRIEETPDGRVIHANPKFSGSTYPLLICDYSTSPPTRKILDVIAVGDPRPEDEV